MAIVKMNKFTLLTFESKKEELLRKLQGFSNAQFVNLQDEELIEQYEVLQGLKKDEVDEEYVELEESLSKAKFALEFLAKYASKKGGLSGLQENRKVLTLDELDNTVAESNWIEIYNKVKEKEQELASIEGQIAHLKGEIEILDPWEELDAPFDSFKELKQTASFVGSIAKQYENAIIEELSDVYVEIISRTSNDINVVVLANKDDEDRVLEVLRGFGFSTFKTGYSDKPGKLITDFRHEAEELRSKKFFVMEAVASLHEELKTMELVFEYYSNRVERKKVTSNFLKTQSIVTIQGWSPIEENDKLTNICNEVLGEDYYLKLEDVKEEEIEAVPIKLKNGSLAQSFESVTEMYSYPKYNEIDPTPLLMPFYMAFFGMMVADAGYGLVMLLAGFVAVKFLNLSEGNKSFAKFFLYLGVPTTAFGFVYGSFFGDAIKIPGLIDPQNDITTVLILSIVFGVIQIFFGLGIKAYSLIREGKYKDAFFDVGSWFITLIAIPVFALGKMGMAPAIVGNIGLVAMIFGMVVIVLTNGRQEATTGAKLGQGAYALYGITSYVADLVSYTRLMALGLAGGSIAGALNLLIGFIPGVAAIIIGPILFVLFHVFNLLLSLLGAYVHTARLQYVEYFSKFYEGGGKPFRPFKTLDKYVNLKRN